MSKPTVVIVGGGYAGVNAAKALDDHADVTLVEPRDAFHHNVAALRALVDPDWPERVFLPFDALLTHGSVVRDRAAQVSPGQVRLGSGATLDADYIVLATGSNYPFPAKAPHANRADAIADIHALRGNLEQANRVLLVGAGPVGLELAGEIAAAWPSKTIVLVEAADEILPGNGYDPRLRAELNRQLDELGVQRRLGSPLTALPEIEPGELKPFQVTTAAGDTIEADLWFRCFGVTPAADYLAGALADARTAEGYITVNEHLQVTGHDRVYAIGDVADADAKKAAAAARQAEVAVANIKAQIEGTGELVRYTIGPVALLVPLGPTGGAAQLPGQPEIQTQEFVSNIKGRDMLVGRYAELLNRPT